MKRLLVLAAVVSLLSVTSATARAADEANLVANSSFEETKPADQFGQVFAKWSGWKYEGECALQVGHVAHSGKTSCLLFGASEPKIREAWTTPQVEPGRYKITAWVRGLEIGTGHWGMTTEFAFDGQYFQLKKNGTFGWTPITYVVDIKQRKKDLYGPAFGLMAPGYFWVDDVSMVKVASDVPLTPQPVLGQEERPIEPPGDVAAGFVRCPECGYRCRPEWKTCYACGSELEVVLKSDVPPQRVLTSFEEKSPFSSGQIVQEHVTDGAKALRLDRSYSTWEGSHNWAGYDYLKVDVYTDSRDPLPLYVEIRDKATRDYWTRVNYNTVVPPGPSTLVLPLDQLYVGEKSRPGRKLSLADVTHLVFNVGDKPLAPVYFDNLRLERDRTARLRFEGLYAFDLGTAQSPLMPGFSRISPATLYGRGRGYGLKDARIWRTFDVLQPDPLYEDFICIEGGGLAVDVPNGKYHVFVNIDSPSGFWGEYQTYRTRGVKAEGRDVVRETMTFEDQKKKYFRFWDVEDSFDEDTFDKYQRAYFTPKEFDVDVTDGQLNLEFAGENWACCVSAVVIYPAEKAAEGRKFLKGVEDGRRFFFNNYFHRVLHRPSGDLLHPASDDKVRGYVLFVRDYMDDVFANDLPRRDEINRPATGFGFAGELEPVTLGLYPLADLGDVKVSVSDLAGPAALPASCVKVGFVSNRLTRVNMDGSVYTISPRMVMPRDTVAVHQGVSRQFWLTVCPPVDAPAGVYRGTITLSPERGKPAKVPLEYRVFRGTLDALDVPAGPWGHEIGIPWYGEDPATRKWVETLSSRSLQRMRDYGLTTFSGLPEVHYKGFRDGKPELDFTRADRQMKLAREAGFTMPVVTYCGFPGLNLYYRDEDAMRKAGFRDYSQFVKALFSAVQQHADLANWLPVYWNIGDEPLGDDLRRSAENAEAYRKAFPKGPPWFTAATSFKGDDPKNPHLPLAKALHVADLNDHDEASVKLLADSGSGWAFYNGGNRWTYGTYMYKAAKQFGMKFRVSWHWNAAAGDPYYALDCREDDYAWCNTNPQGELVPSVHFERDIREGVDDYRYILTLARLAAEKHDSAAQSLIQPRLDSFHLGQREHNELLPPSDWREFRLKAAAEIERLRTK